MWSVRPLHSLWDGKQSSIPGRSRIISFLLVQFWSQPSIIKNDTRQFSECSQNTLGRKDDEEGWWEWQLATLPPMLWPSKTEALTLQPRWQFLQWDYLLPKLWGWIDLRQSCEAELMSTLWGWVDIWQRHETGLISDRAVRLSWLQTAVRLNWPHRAVILSWPQSCKAELTSDHNSCKEMASPKNVENHCDWTKLTTIKQQ